MEWIKKNDFTALLVVFLALMIFSPDAKAWFLRQVAATGLLNSGITEKPTEKKAGFNFAVQDEGGNVQQLSDMRGKVVFINFWASWCPPCRAEFPSIQQFYEKYKNRENMVFLTVNMDDNPQLGRNYLDKEKHTLPFLVPTTDIPKELFEGSLPTTVILDKQGQIRFHKTGVADYNASTFLRQIDGLLAE